MKRLWLLLCIVLGMAVSVRAQDDAPIPEFSFSPQASSILVPFEFQWMPDGGSFFFRFIPAEGIALPAFQYFVGQHNLKSLGNLPSQSIFTYEQKAAYSAYSWSAFPSPDGRFAVYTIQKTSCGEAPDCVPLLGLVDLQMGAYTRVRKGSDVGYTVRWSADSSAFLVIDQGEYGGLGGVYYGAVSQIMGDSEARLKLLTNYVSGSLGFVDISPDGQRVLLREMWEDLTTGLILWDARTSTSEAQFAARADGQFLLDDEAVAGASFIPGDDRRILVILERGIVRYDLETGEIELIDPAINADWVSWAYFSPDGCYVATYTLRESQVALYALES